jgi:hypothetical protein
MNTPTRTLFKSELAAYRQKLLVSENKDQPWLPEAVQVLDNWRDHPDVEAAWTTLTRRLPSEAICDPGQFIDLVLARWFAAFKLEEASREGPAVEAKVRSVATRQWGDGEWASAAYRMQEADKFKKLGKEVLGHKKKDSPRKRFIIGWAEAFRSLCGRPLNNVICVLTEVVFGGTVTREMVSDAQKPTTKRGRDIRPTK